MSTRLGTVLQPLKSTRAAHAHGPDLTERYLSEPHSWFRCGNPHPGRRRRKAGIVRDSSWTWGGSLDSGRIARAAVARGDMLNRQPIASYLSGGPWRDNSGAQ